MPVELGTRPRWDTNSHSSEMSVFIWISAALSHVMEKICFLGLDVFRTPQFEKEVRATALKASIGGKATALHSQNQAVPVLEGKKKKLNYSSPTPTQGFDVERNLLWFK